MKKKLFLTTIDGEERCDLFEMWKKIKTKTICDWICRVMDKQHFNGTWKI